jgi:trk system potassium uptake protein TrkA
MALARALSANGFEVLAVDRDAAQVQAAAAFATEALQLDASLPEAMASLAPGTRDLCVCAIGDESREGAILVTALMRQLGGKRVVARATDDLLGRVLAQVGAHEVVQPERDFGERLARRLMYRNYIDQIPLGDDLLVAESQVPPLMVGRTLTQLKLPQRFGIQILAVRQATDGRDALLMPDAQRRFSAADTLVLVGHIDAVNRFMEHH